MTYEANRKAWMTSEIFSTWLRRFNNMMSLKKKKALLFLDNCSSHPPMDLSHVKLVFLPPNTTSRLQPMDAGIIQAVKTKYRKRMLRHVSVEIDECNSAEEVSKNITVLDAIHWLQLAWKELDASTMQKCFARCGFNANVESDLAQEVIEPDLLAICPNATTESCIEMDSNIGTSPPESGVEKDGSEDAGDDDEDEETAETPVEPLALANAKRATDPFIQLALQFKCPEMLNTVNELRDQICKLQWNENTKKQQSKIVDFFKKK